MRSSCSLSYDHEFKLKQNLLYLFKESWINLWDVWDFFECHFSTILICRFGSFTDGLSYNKRIVCWKVETKNVRGYLSILTHVMLQMIIAFWDECLPYFSFLPHFLVFSVNSWTKIHAEHFDTNYRQFQNAKTFDLWKSKVSVTVLDFQIIK